ncbi:acyl-CoA dehydrogenase family protein [Tsuneonella mangrovi]|uniref:acyl-CoA dehydrogenase family protein n=1 Tax=Tsuneonella mangrovi TaxID=1982042 RepID=UPI000BA218D7|nr:acyl-CoA dehydrogenase family protein [Tsuneonella mangrovi]
MDTNELLEPFDRMLQAACPPDAIRAVEQGESFAAMWGTIAESGFLDALVSEEAGGFGLPLAEIEPLLKALGRHAVPLPVGETMVARALLAAAGHEPPSGAIALAVADNGAGVPLPFGMVCEHLLVDRGDCIELVGAGDVHPTPTGVRGSVDAVCDLGVAAGAVRCERPAEGLRPVGALLRAVSMAGAAEHLLEMTTSYANERVQFGKPIGRQQALQQQIAVMAEDVIAMRLAVQLACAGGFPVDLLAAATAKSIASSSAPRVAATAHAIHGAIGISEEFDLQLYTRRLHEWRFACGSETYWNRLLGTARLGSAERSIDWVRENLFA